MFELPMQDALRCGLGLVRQPAAKWTFDPKRVGLLGYSAKPNLADHVALIHECSRCYACGPSCSEERGMTFCWIVACAPDNRFVQAYCESSSIPFRFTIKSRAIEVNSEIKPIVQFNDTDSIKTLLTCGTLTNGQSGAVLSSGSAICVSSIQTGNKAQFRVGLTILTDKFRFSFAVVELSRAKIHIAEIDSAIEGDSAQVSIGTLETTGKPGEGFQQSLIARSNLPRSASWQLSLVAGQSLLTINELLSGQAYYPELVSDYCEFHFQTEIGEIELTSLSISGSMSFQRPKTASDSRPYEKQVEYRLNQAVAAGDVPLQLSLCKELCEISRLSFGPESLITRESEKNVALASMRAGDFQASEIALRELLEKMDSDYGHKHPRRTRILLALCDVLLKKGEVACAQQYAIEATRIAQEWIGEESEEFLEGLFHMAQVHFELGHFLDSKQLYEWILHRANGTEYRFISKTALFNNYGMCLHRIGLLGEARAYYESAVAAAGLAGLAYSNSPEHCILLANLALVLADLGDFEQAFAHYEAVLNTVSGYRIGLPQMQFAINGYAVAMSNVGQTLLSQRLFETQIERMTASCDQYHPQLLTAYNNLGLTLTKAGDIHRGSELLLLSLNLRMRVCGFNSAEVAESLQNLGQYEKRVGSLSLAADYLFRSLSIHWALFGDAHPRTAESLYSVGYLMLLSSRRRSGLYYLKLAFECCWKASGVNIVRLSESECCIHVKNLLEIRDALLSTYLEAEENSPEKVLDLVLRTSSLIFRISQYRLRAASVQG